MFNNLISKVLERVAEKLVSPLTLGNQSRYYGVDRGTQILLYLRYKELLDMQRQRLDFCDTEFRAFSQNGEDGILLYIFALIGTTDRKVVEVCAGNGIECNAANLIINHGWDGLLFDGQEESLKRGRQFYQTCPDTFRLPPRLVNAWITRENINILISENGLEGNIDLLSLDMDGVDYWIWDALSCVCPRVVVLEYNNRWGAARCVTVPYSNQFRNDGDYFGASLSAFVKLGKRKGYRLIGCNRVNTNAFFVRNGIGDDVFPEVPAGDCLTSMWAKHQYQNGRPLIENLEWIEV